MIGPYYLSNQTGSKLAGRIPTHIRSLVTTGKFGPKRKKKTLFCEKLYININIHRTTYLGFSIFIHSFIVYPIHVICCLCVCVSMPFLLLYFFQIIYFDFDLFFLFAEMSSIKTFLLNFFYFRKQTFFTWNLNDNNFQFYFREILIFDVILLLNYMVCVFLEQIIFLTNIARVTFVSRSSTDMYTIFFYIFYVVSHFYHIYERFFHLFFSEFYF